jgi:hypothetical protein
MAQTSASTRLSPEKAAFINALATFTDEQIAAFMAGAAAPATLPATKVPVSYPAPYLNGNPGNVLFIGDTHIPFMIDGYLEFCREEQERWDCGRVIHIGDVMDFHAISYHESDPDGMSAGDELTASQRQLCQLFAMFPNVDSMLGNHDLLVSRKAKTAGLSQNMVRSMAEILDAPPTWKFHDELELFGVGVGHGGAGGDALRMATHSRQSRIEGHRHSLAYVQWLVSKRDAIFGMQVGSGMDDKTYAAAYGRPMAKKSVISCGVLLDEGRTPLVRLMPR